MPVLEPLERGRPLGVDLFQTFDDQAVEQALDLLTRVEVHVGDRSPLVPLEVQPEGGKRMAYDAFLRGLR